MSVVLLTADLMCASQVSAAATRAGVTLTTAMNVAAMWDQLAGRTMLVIDLNVPDVNWPQLVPLVKQQAPGIRVVAFGPHVQEALLQQAVAAGCDQVMARGQFYKQAETVLRQAT